jgi:hypothetical protein
VRPEGLCQFPVTPSGIEPMLHDIYVLFRGVYELLPIVSTLSDLGEIWQKKYTRNGVDQLSILRILGQ